MKKTACGGKIDVRTLYDNHYARGIDDQILD